MYFNLSCNPELRNSSHFPKLMSVKKHRKRMSSFRVCIHLEVRRISFPGRLVHVELMKKKKDCGRVLCAEKCNTQRCARQAPKLTSARKKHTLLLATLSFESSFLFGKILCSTKQIWKAQIQPRARYPDGGFCFSPSKLLV